MLQAIVHDGPVFLAHAREVVRMVNSSSGRVVVPDLFAACVAARRAQADATAETSMVTALHAVERLLPLDSDDLCARLRDAAYGAEQAYEALPRGVYSDAVAEFRAATEPRFARVHRLNEAASRAACQSLWADLTRDVESRVQGMHTPEELQIAIAAVQQEFCARAVGPFQYDASMIDDVRAWTTTCHVRFASYRQQDEEEARRR